MMNHNAVFVSRKERIQNTLCPILSQLYDKVHEKQFPLPDQIDKACSLLQQYLDELSKGPLSDVEIDFTDIPAVSITSADSKITSQWSLLSRISMQKLLYADAPCLDHEQIAVLKEHGCLVNASITSQYGKYDFYVVTSKALELLKTLTPHRQALPKAIHEFMQNKNLIRLCQAAAICLYYQRTDASTPYFTFVFPKYSDLMFGCQIDEEKETTYVMAGILHPAKKQEAKEFLQEFNENHKISKLVIVVPSVSEKTQWEEVISSGDRVSCFVLWEA